MRLVSEVGSQQEDDKHKHVARGWARGEKLINSQLEVYWQSKACSVYLFN